MIAKSKELAEIQKKMDQSELPTKKPTHPTLLKDIKSLSFRVKPGMKNPKIDIEAVRKKLNDPAMTHSPSLRHPHSPFKTIAEDSDTPTELVQGSPLLNCSPSIKNPHSSYLESPLLKSIQKKRFSESPYSNRSKGSDENSPLLEDTGEAKPGAAKSHSKMNCPVVYTMKNFNEESKDEVENVQGPVESSPGLYKSCNNVTKPSWFRRDDRRKASVLLDADEHILDTTQNEQSSNLEGDNYKESPCVVDETLEATSPSNQLTDLESKHQATTGTLTNIDPLPVQQEVVKENVGSIVLPAIEKNIGYPSLMSTEPSTVKSLAELAFESSHGPNEKAKDKPSSSNNVTSSTIGSLDQLRNSYGQNQIEDETLKEEQIQMMKQRETRPSKMSPAFILEGEEKEEPLEDPLLLQATSDFEKGYYSDSQAKRHSWETDNKKE